MPTQTIWLASYPRSGNTLLRTVLYQCFGLVSASIYPDEFSESKELKAYVGHIERDNFPGGSIHLIKTHEPPDDDGPAVYIVRDGRAACVSLWEFWDRPVSLATIIAGQHGFGTWAEHLSAWQAWARPNTLFVKYEDILDNLPPVLEKLSIFVGTKIINSKIPERQEIASSGGKYVRMRSDWRQAMTPEDMELFQQINGPMMEKLGYTLN